MKTIKFLFAGLLVCSLATESFSQNTKLVVRARAKDAKFIGTKHAGAYGNVLVSVTDALTGKVLAKGITEGGSGDTKLLLQTPINRYQPITDDSTAKFEAQLAIDEPTLVTVSLAAPSNKKRAKTSQNADFNYKPVESIVSSTQVWVIPGKDIDGEGLILEVPGLVVDIYQDKNVVSLGSLADKKLTVKSHLALQCGCVITAGGLWNADNIEVKGVLKQAGKKVQDISLKLVGPSLYEGDFTNIEKKGKYEVQVYAYDSVTKNTGVDRINIEVN